MSIFCILLAWMLFNVFLSFSMIILKNLTWVHKKLKLIIYLCLLQNLGFFDSAHLCSAPIPSVLPGVTQNLRLPCSSVVKETACNAGELGLIPGQGRSPGEGNFNLLQYSCLGHSMDRAVWQAVHRVTRVRHDFVAKSPPPPPRI